VVADSRDLQVGGTDQVTWRAAGFPRDDHIGLGTD